MPFSKNWLILGTGGIGGETAPVLRRANCAFDSSTVIDAGHRRVSALARPYTPRQETTQALFLNEKAPVHPKCRAVPKANQTIVTH